MYYGTLINIEQLMGSEYLLILKSALVFADDYASFRYEDGFYVCDRIERVSDYQHKILTNIKISVSDGRIDEITYVDTTIADGYSYVGDTTCEFFNYGTTELPGSEVGDGTSTYTGGGIAFEYPAGFEHIGNEIYNAGFQAFSVIHFSTDSASASIYENLNDKIFESTLLPEYEEALGTDIVEWDVFTYKSDSDVEILVIEYWYELEGMEVYQADLIICVSENNYSQVTCMTFEEASDDFIGLIADSMRFTE